VRQNSFEKSTDAPLRWYLRNWSKLEQTGKVTLPGITFSAAIMNASNNDAEAVQGVKQKKPAGIFPREKAAVSTASNAEFIEGILKFWSFIAI
jgi:hypothetical protein